MLKRTGLKTSAHSGRRGCETETMTYALISIAVSDYGVDFSSLPGALTASEELVAWALKATTKPVYKVEVVTDRAGEPVTIKRVKEAFDELLGEDLERLIVHFAGHGIRGDTGRPLWLLSKAATLGEAINPHTLKRRLRRYSVKQITIIGDACRKYSTFGEEIGSGSGVVDLAVGPLSDREEDSFLGAADGMPAYMVEKKGGKPAYTIFTRTLVDGLNGEALVPKINDRSVVSRSLVYFLRKEAPKRAKNVLGKKLTVDPRPGLVLPVEYATFDKPPRSETRSSEAPPEAEPSVKQSVEENIDAVLAYVRTALQDVEARKIVDHRGDNDFLVRIDPERSVFGVTAKRTDRFLFFDEDVTKDIGPVVLWPSSDGANFQITPEVSSDQVRLVIDGPEGFSPVPLDLNLEQVAIAGMPATLDTPPEWSLGLNPVNAASLVGDEITFDMVRSLFDRNSDGVLPDVIDAAMSAEYLDFIGKRFEVRQLCRYYASKGGPVPFDLAAYSGGEILWKRDTQGVLSATLSLPEEKRPDLIVDELEVSKHVPPNELVNARLNAPLPALRATWEVLVENEQQGYPKEIAGLVANLVDHRITTLSAAGVKALAKITPIEVAEPINTETMKSSVLREREAT